MAAIKRALISVSDKRNLVDFAQALGGVPATLQGLPQWLPAGLSMYRTSPTPI